MTDRRQDAFGDPVSDDRVKAERWGGELAAADVATMVDGYRALHERTEGRYGEFLRQAARCQTCTADAAIPIGKRPLPLLCGAGTATAAELTDAQAALAPYRRDDQSIRLDPEAPASVEALRAFLDERGLAGLSLGHCGWGDLTARVRGAQLRDGVKLMVLGADWYPISQCANFLIDRYPSWDSTLRLFFSHLGLNEERARTFIVEQRVYLGNVLLCYRTGYDRTGTKNLSPRSFDNCTAHLRRHIDALAPEILVTFGSNGARAAASVLVGASAEDEDALAKLRADVKLSQAMESLYANRSGSGVACVLGDRRLTYVPLYHPSYGHVNKYRDDYAALKRLLGDGSPR